MDKLFLHLSCLFGVIAAFAFYLMSLSRKKFLIENRSWPLYAMTTIFLLIHFFFFAHLNFWSYFLLFAISYLLTRLFLASPNI